MIEGLTHDFDRLSDFHHPKDASSYVTRAELLTNRREFDAAIKDFSEALKLDPTNARALRNHGVACYLKCDFEKAVEIWTKAIENDPADIQALGYVAWIRATCPDDRHRNGNKAVELATKACELSDWKDSKLLSCLAAAYAESGDFTNAIKWQEKVVELTVAKKTQATNDPLELYRANKPFREELKRPAE